MNHLAQKHTHYHEYHISGSVEEDRKYFSNELPALNYGEKHFYRFDMTKIDKLDLVTLGLVAWLHDEISSNGHGIEFVNAGDKVRNILEIYKLK